MMQILLYANIGTSWGILIFIHNFLCFPPLKLSCFPVSKINIEHIVSLSMKNIQMNIKFYCVLIQSNIATIWGDCAWAGHVISFRVCRWKSKKRIVAPVSRHSGWYPPWDFSCFSLRCLQWWMVHYTGTLADQLPLSPSANLTSNGQLCHGNL